MHFTASTSTSLTFGHASAFIAFTCENEKLPACHNTLHFRYLDTLVCIRNILTGSRSTLQAKHDCAAN